MQCTVLPLTALHCSALLCTSLHCTVLHCTALQCIALCTIIHCTALHCSTALHYTALHCTTLHCTVLHCTGLYCTALHCTALYPCMFLSVLVRVSASVERFGVSRMRDFFIKKLNNTLNIVLHNLFWCILPQSNNQQTKIIGILQNKCIFFSSSNFLLSRSSLGS